MAGIISAAGTALLAGGYVYQRSTSESCPSPIPLQQDFNLTEYLGTWHEMKRSKNIIFEKGDCVTADYALKSNGYVSVLNSQVLPETHSVDYLYGTARCNSWDKAHCGVRFSSF